jgi:hypothetical protein
MEATLKTRPRPKQFSWLLFLVFLAFMLLVTRLPQAWASALLVSVLAASAALSVAEGVVVLARTRWLFRATGSFGNALLAVAMIWLVLQPMDHWAFTWLLVGVVVGIAVLTRLARIVARAWYPRQSEAFDLARLNARGLDVVRLRHIPTLLPLAS